VAFEFVEDILVELPDVDDQVSAFSEHEYKEEHGLIVEVVAIHEGMTRNYNFYPSKALSESLASWVTPYPKPIIINHDLKSEPIGRIMAAKMEEEIEGTSYVKLQMAVTDPEAIRKVLDERYMTGSVGGSAEQANCSVCNVDWSEASMTNIPCKHRRGKVYKGKMCYMEMNGISFKEYSFVNAPADEKSRVSGISSSSKEDQEDGWVRAARVFSLDMGKESIIEFCESQEDHNVLDGLKKKEAAPIYMNLKGAFLSAMAVAESEKEEIFDETNKESDVSDELIKEEEDILDVTDTLSSDLNQTEVEETEEVEEESNAEAEATVEETSVDEDVEEAEEVEEENSTEDDVVAEVEESSDEGEDTDDVVAESEEETVSETDLEEEENEETDETDLNESLEEKVATLESRVEEFETREQTLLEENKNTKEENGRLKDALKRNLAERVVDGKIAVGIIESADREDQVKEHVTRSASSLADSIRDLASMPAVNRSTESVSSAPVVEEESAAVLGEEDVVSTDSETEKLAEKTVDPEEGLYKLINGAFITN